MESFNQIWQSIVQETQLKNRWVETTPWVLVKQPAPFYKKKKRTYLRRIGNVDALELTHPRTEKRVRHLDRASWKQCDVRLASPELLRKVDTIEAEMSRLRREREKAIQDHFWDNDPMSWEEIQEAKEPWSNFRRVLTRFKDGKATEKDLRDAMNALFPR